MLCKWCRQPMAARKGKVFCSDRCRVSNARYEKGWDKYLAALRNLEHTHNKLLAERQLLEHAT